MNSDGQIVRSKIIHMQKEVLDLKSQLKEQHVNSQKIVQSIFIEQIEWFDSLQLIAEDFKKNTQEDYKSIMKSLERLQKKMDRSFLQNKVFKILPTTLSLDEEGVKVVDTRQDFDFESGSILEVVRQGYQWNGIVLRKTEVITVKNELE